MKATHFRKSFIGYIGAFAVIVMLALISFLSLGNLNGAPAAHAATISNASQLSSAIRGGSGTYELTTNITWSGCGRDEGNTFSGTLDGKGYTITLSTGYSGTTSTGDNVSIGLMVSNLRGTIKNVNIVLTDNPYLYQYTAKDKNFTNWCGIIAGTLQSGAVIDNVHLTVDGSISYYAEDKGSGVFKKGGYGIILGGFAGRSQDSATIRNSSVTVNGAIHGKAEDYHGNNDEGTSSRAHTGGFVGEIESGTLTMTDNALFGGSNGAIGSGAIKSESDHKSDRAGGVVGVVRSGSTLNVNGFLFDYNGVVTVFRNNSDCGLFVGKVYGSLSASNIVKSSTCTATSYENNDNTRQVTSRADVSTVASTIQGAGKVISAESVGNGSGTFSNSILYETKAYLGSTANASYGTFKISKINNGNYTARITAGSSYVPSAIKYSSTYSNCYASKPTKGSYYEISIAKTNTSYAGYVATPSYSLTASGSNKTYDGSGITYTIYPGSANAAFTNNVYINSSGGGGTTRSSANANTVTTHKNAGTYTITLSDASGNKLATNTLLYANATNAPNKVTYYNGQSYTVTISQRQATISWSNTSRPYNGNAQLPTATVTNLVSGDSCTVNLSGAGTNAGSYTATITSLSNSNYSMPATKTQSFTITKVTPTLTVTNNKAIFEREPLSNTNLTIQAKNPNNTSLTVSGSYGWPGSVPQYPVASNSGSYTVTYTVSDTTNYNNATISVTLTVTRYNPTVVITTYLDGAINGSGTFANVSIDGTTSTYQVSKNGKTINDSFSLSVTPKDGYYLEYIRKNSGLNVANHYGNLSHTYTITVDEAYNGAATIYYDAYFRTITGSFTTSYTYNAAAQGPQSNSVTSYTVTNYYSGTATDGTAYGTSGFGSTTKPTKAGSYTMITNLVYTSTGNTLGTKTLAFTINKKELILSWSNTSPVYNGYNQIPIATATNLQSGDTCTITVTGAQSQAGEGYVAKASAVSNANYKLPAADTVEWKILPKTLPLSYWQGTVAASYMFTGERILPVPVVTDSQLGILQKDKDYTVSYGENYSGSTGGKVYVTGIGNYKNQTSVSFEISKAPQTAFFTSPKYNNSNVGLEPLRPDAAEFEVAFLAGAGYTGNYIIVYGYTDAIHPDQYKGETDPSRYTAKRMLFEVSSGVNVEYIKDEIVIIGGKYYSQTTARLYLSRDTFTPNATVQYGITTITLRASANPNYDDLAVYPMPGRLIDDGYEQDLGQDATPLTHRLFIKKNHTAGGSFLSDITVTYGDPVFDITAGLNSGLTDYEIESSDDNILTIAEAPGNPLVRIATIHNAGEVTLTLIHKGVSDLDMPANSYNAVTARITVRVNKAVLTVSPNRQTVIYGTQPVYTAQSFTYLGFKYNDDISIIKSVNSGYNPQTMKDEGTYYLTASGVELNTEYINYEFEYPAGAGILEITRKTLYAYIEDARKVYGEENPALAISYLGFIDGESEHNAANFVAPEIDFNGVDRLTPVGTYQIRLRDGSARNYTIDVSGTANLEIRPAKVTIILENRTEEYNARSVYSYEPSILGIPGGTVPSGYATVSYYNGQDYTQVAPVNVGEYKVKVEYTAAAGDNYEGTVEYFDNVITILPIAPGIELESAVRTYNNVAYGEVPFKTALLPGVSGGSAPTGTLSFLYSRDGGEFTEALPRISGNYTVRVTYTLAEGATDNYIDGYYYDFADAVIIEKAEVTITLEAAKAQYASSDGVNPDRVRANEAVPHGVTGEAYLNPAVYPYELSYRYLVDGEWQELPPYNAGSYKVEVTFTPLFDINYKLTVQVINDAVIIEGADPTLFLEKKEISYTGKRVTSNNARAEGIAGGTAPRGTFQYLFARHGSGNFSMDPVINVNIDNGVNVGYDVKVVYIPGSGDNYRSVEFVFPQALIVLPVTPRISFNPVTVNFTGEAFSFSKVAASVTGILGGSIPRGALSYEFVDNNGSRLDNPPVNSGVYNLKVIFTPDLSGSDNSTANYTSAWEIFYGYVTINKVAPKISVTPRTFDFTNQPVTLAAEDIRVDGVNASFVPTGTVQVQYCPANGDEWSNEGPTQSGNYKVRVIYTAAEDENYINTVKIFNNILKIDNIMPVFLPLGLEQHIYNGASADVSFKPQIDGPAGKGTLSLSYRLNNGAPNNTWQGKVPKDVGEYDVRINYTMNASGDNYKSASQVFEKALIIVPREIKITPAFGQSKAYDGLPIEGIKYTVVYEGEDDFIKSITLKGALSAGDATDVGLYPITLGTLEIDVKNNGAGYANNFVIVLTDKVFYEISPAMAEITFSELSIERLIYSPGDRKSNDVHVTVIGNGRPIAHSFTILGDDENVGSFKVIVNILDSNFYADEADCVKEYKIIPADMDEVENIFENKKYTYSGNAITFAADRVYAGASVEYTYGTEKRNSAFSFKDVGVYEVTAVISKENYNTVTISATLTIVKAVPAVNVLPYTGELRYGDKLPTIACDNENGIIALDEGQVLVPGTHEYTWTFVPDDQDNYEIVTGKIYLTVEKAKTELLVRGANIQNASNPSRFSAQVASSGGILQGKIEIKYYDSEGNVYTQLPSKGGKYTVVVTYSGDEFYDASTFTDTVFVKEDPNYSWLYIAIGGIAGIAIIAGIISAARKRAY